jgi:hypothetical protein
VKVEVLMKVEVKNPNGGPSMYQKAHGIPIRIPTGHEEFHPKDRGDPSQSPQVAHQQLQRPSTPLN